MASRCSTAVPDFGGRADRHLASSAQLVQQSAFAGRGSAGVGIIEKRELFSCGGIARADFNSQSALPSGGAHDVCRDDLLHQLRLAKTIQPRCGKNDGIVFALFQLAQARVDVAAQGMNLEVRAKRLELRLAAKAAGADARAAAASRR